MIFLLCYLKLLMYKKGGSMDSLLEYFSSLNPSTFVAALPGNIAQGIIWGLMALGVFITYKLLNFADLTVAGANCKMESEYVCPAAEEGGNYAAEA